MIENNECAFAAMWATELPEVNSEDQVDVNPLPPNIRLPMESLERREAELLEQGLSEDEMMGHDDLEFEMRRRVCFRNGCNLTLLALTSTIFSEGVIRDPGITLALDCANTAALVPACDSYVFVASEQPETPFSWLIASAGNSCDTEDK